MDDGYLKKPTTPKVCVVCIYIYVLSCSSDFFVGGFDDFEVCKIHID